MSNYAPTRPPADASGEPRRYLPGMGRDWLLPLYDPFSRLIGIESAHRKLSKQAELESADRVLEIGCGTANLSLLVKRMNPRLVVVGLDPDARALTRAGRKARRAGLVLKLDRGFADELPYPDASFDRVLSSLMFHHLEADRRLATLQEVARVLGPGGSLHLLDFGDSRDDHRLAGLLARHNHTARDHPGDRIPTLMREAGLSEPAETGQVSRGFGQLTYYRARRER
jgi:ubiquinone/menaquinone biosynthesis C-methylase UbiE